MERSPVHVSLGERFVPLITIVCPRCRDAYHVQESMRGKPWRCPRSGCRHVFLVDDQPPPPEQASGSVGDIIPLVAAEEDVPPVRGTHVADVIDLLPAEPAAPDLPLESLQPDQPVAAQDWRSPPPVRRAPPPAEERPRPTPKPKREEPQPPRVVEAGDWDAPPQIRRNEEPDRAGPKNDDAPPPRGAREKPDRSSEAPSDHDLAVKPRTRWVKWVILPVILVTFAGLAGGLVMVIKAFREREERLANEAEKLFEGGQFGASADLYAKLAKDFPDSDGHAFYQFRYDLTDLLKRLADPDSDLGEALDHAGQFLKERQKDPLLEKDAPELGQALVKRLSDFARASQAELKNDEPLAMEPRWRPVATVMRRIKLAKGAKPPDWAGLDTNWSELRQAVARLKAKQDVLAKLHDLVKAKAGYAAVVAVEDYLRDIRPSFPDVADSDEARKVLDQAFDNHLAGVRYQTVQTDGAGPSRAGGGQLDEPSILFDPELKPAGVVRPAGQPEEVPALALVRGVLYAMDRGTGRVRWARRVGIDTTALPVVVPRRVALKDLLLVLSSDTNTLTALTVQGAVEWSYALPAPVLGRPVVAGRRAYLATYTGEVHEIELIEGRRLGTYNLGQRLTLGGVAEPGSGRVYFPADDGCVYVLDVARQRCETILYSRHPAGSLRGEPILLPPAGPESPGFLVLNQASGLDSVRLRVFDLPVRDRRAAERPLSPPPALDGWTWFAPYHDPEKLLLLSDAGRLGLFGIRQPNNRDRALFSLLPGGSYNLAARFGGAARRGRGEVVQVEGDDVWVLASGRMQRLRLAWGRQQGPRLVDVWPKPLEVGSPVHASQALGAQLVSVTQPAGRSCTWVSAVEDETGELLWRRQLGIVAGGPPVPLRPPQGEPIWLTIDQAGALFALDPGRYAARPGARWLSDDRPVLIAQGLPENLDQPPVVLPAPDGTSAYALAFPGDGEEMVVRQVTPAPNQRQLEARETRVPLDERLAGRPVIVGPYLMVPRADGVVTRFPLPLPATPVRQDGPTWRADRVGAEARCLVVPTGDTRFVTSDGGRGLMAWDWPPGAPAHTPLPAGRGDEPTLALSARVVHAAAIPGTPRLVVSDPAGNVTLVEMDAKGALAVRREWRLGGEITTGPFIRPGDAGPRVGCVVNRTRLVWLDPTADGEAWPAYETGGAAIVGEPQLCDGLLVVADQSGRFVALNPADGKPVGKGYALRGSVAPVASPVPFQKGRLLAPLSDGTVLLLSAERLR